MLEHCLKRRILVFDDAACIKCVWNLGLRRRIDIVRSVVVDIRNCSSHGITTTMVAIGKYWNLSDLRLVIRSGDKVKKIHTIRACDNRIHGPTSLIHLQSLTIIDSASYDELVRSRKGCEASTKKARTVEIDVFAAINYWEARAWAKFHGLFATGR